MTIRRVETQYLTITGARGVGLDEHSSELRFVDEVNGPQEVHAMGLRPLLVVGVTVPAFNLYFRQLVNPGRPAPLSALLKAAWSPVARLGMPTYLEFNEFTASVDRGFLRWVREVGVTPRIVERRNFKSLVARQVQSSKQLLFASTFGPFPSATQRGVDLAAANQSLAYYEAFKN